MLSEVSRASSESERATKIAPISLGIAGRPGPVEILERMEHTVVCSQGLKFKVGGDEPLCTKKMKNCLMNGGVERVPV